MGKNLRDHLAVLITPFFINESVTLMLDRDISLQSFIDYHIHGKGIYDLFKFCYEDFYKI